MIDWTPWIDKNGYVKPRKDWDDSGNGVCYSAIAAILDPSFGESRHMVDWYKPGCLMRTPDNAFGQESHDDYMGVAARSIIYGSTEIPRQIMKYGMAHFFIMRNIPGSGFKAHLYRFPHIWMLMFCAAWPTQKWLKHIPLWLFQKLLKLKLNQLGEFDGSGAIQQWLFMVSYRAMYGENGTFKKWLSGGDIKLAFANQYDVDHPFQQLIKEWK